MDLFNILGLDPNCSKKELIEKIELYLKANENYGNVEIKSELQKRVIEHYKFIIANSFEEYNKRIKIMRKMLANNGKRIDLKDDDFFLNYEKEEEEKRKDEAYKNQEEDIRKMFASRDIDNFIKDYNVNDEISSQKHHTDKFNIYDYMDSLVNTGEIEKSSKEKDDLKGKLKVFKKPSKGMKLVKRAAIIIAIGLTILGAGSTINYNMEARELENAKSNIAIEVTVLDGDTNSKYDDYGLKDRCMTEYEVLPPYRNVNADEIKDNIYAGDKFICRVSPEDLERLQENGFDFRTLPVEEAVELAEAKHTLTGEFKKYQQDESNLTFENPTNTIKM